MAAPPEPTVRASPGEEAPAAVSGQIVELPPGLDALLAGLPEDARVRIRLRAARWQAWSPAERAAFAERAGAWDGQAPRARMERREDWRAWQALPAMQREQVAGMSREFATLPPDARQALRAEFDALDVSVQRGWRLGPVLGADYASLHGLLAQVPVEQRAPLLEVLHAMSSAQRAQLAVLTQRTSPQARDDLRRELIATPPERRQQWLWEQMDR